MSAPVIQPQLITDRVVERIRGRILPAASYLARDDFESRLIDRECSQLLAVAPYYGHLAYGLASSMWGDETGVRYHFDRARELGTQDFGQADFLHAQSIGNLGFFLEAFDFFSRSFYPESGYFTNRVGFVPVVGAFNTLKSRIEEAERMNIQLPDSFPAEAARKAAELLESYGTSDADVAAVLDIAGTVLRNRRLFFLGNTAGWSVVDHPSLHAVQFLYQVDQTPEQVAEMNFEFAERLAQRDGPIPESVVVSFMGTRQ